MRYLLLILFLVCKPLLNTQAQTSTKLSSTEEGTMLEHRNVLQSDKETAKQDIEFQYRLDNGDWQTIQAKDLPLKDLEGGAHSIQFRAGNTENWTESSDITLKVSPPFYNMFWFYVLCVYGMGGLLGIAYGLIKNKAAYDSKLATERKINHLEQRALSASMNPHFIFNALNSVHELTRKGSQMDVDYYFAQFGKLIRANLEASTKESILLYEEIDRLRIYLNLEKLRFKEQFEWEIDIPFELDTEYISIPSMIIQPYVENAIWHGIRPKGKGKVSIKLIEEDRVLRILIIDDGIGIHESLLFKSMKNQHKSIGQKVTAERIRLFGLVHGKEGKVNITSSDDKGTQVEIILPLLVPDA